MKKKKLTAFDLCSIALCTAITAVLSQISVPMPYGVPLTLQTFAVPLAGVLLGPSKGALSILLYVLLGAVGVPVFTGFTGGIGIIFGPTGGFILAFPLMAALAGLGAKSNSVPLLICGLLSAVIVDYAGGLFMFMAVTGSSPQVSFMACVLPFLPTEAIKTTLVGTAGTKCRQRLRKAGFAL